MYEIKSYSYNGNCIESKLKLPDDAISTLKQLLNLPFIAEVHSSEPVIFSFSSFTIDGVTYED